MKFYLEEPTLERKQDVIEYVNEFKTNHSPINGASLFATILYGAKYEDCLENIYKLTNPTYAAKINRLPGKTFFLIRAKDNKLIGMINIRYKFSETKYKFRGHIGYSIRPTERQKGYNKINLYLGLEKAQQMGLTKVKLCCAKDNIGSNKTIQALGGTLMSCEIDPEDNTLTNIYEIDIPYSLKTYQPHIKKEV